MEKDPKPNIIVITSHDLGRHLGCYGVETVQTPALDELAAKGTRFSEYFAVCPVCSPSRGAAMTGRYPQSNGLQGLVHDPWLWELNDDEKHLAQILKSHGYYTANLNIQHESRDWKRLGFDDYFDCLSEPRKGRATARETADETVRFLNNHKNDDRPFYAQIGFFETHTPHGFGGAEPDASKGVFVPERIIEDEHSIQHMAALQGAVKALDNAMGTIIDALNDSGLADNTLLVFTADHGIEAARDKWSCYDPGIEIPLIVHWPQGGITGGKVFGQLLSNIDLFPTLLELAGLPIPDNVQGISFAPVFGQEAFRGRGAIFGTFQGKENRYIRTHKAKMILNFMPDRLLKVPVDIRKKQTIWGTSSSMELYDLENDPLEFKNVAEDDAYAEMRQDLENQVWQWMESLDDPLLKEPGRTPFYDRTISYYQRWAKEQRD